MDTILQDLRYAVRTLTANPGFTLIAVIALALGIGANSSIFSIVNGILLRPLDFPEADRLVRVEEVHAGQPAGGQVTYANFNDLDEGLDRDSSSFQSLGASRLWSFNLTEGSEPEQVQGAQVSRQLFDVLKVSPLQGRLFTAAEDQPGGEPVVVISYGLWQRRFGGDPDLVGKTVRVSDVSPTVVGIMPPGFTYPNASQLWAPLVPGGSLRNNRRSHLLTVVARLRDGATTARAASETEAVASRISDQYPGVDPDLSMRAVGLQEQIVAPIRPALLVLLVAVGFVLLIACANVANLTLARAVAREKEMAIRAALGAGRWRLIRQTLTESLLLAAGGGLLGLLLTVWSLDAIKGLNVSRASSDNIPRLSDVSLDWRVLAFTLAISLLTGVLFGMAPAFRLSNVALAGSLKEGGRATSTASRNRLRHALVIAEIAMSLVLLVGAGLLVNSFVRLSQVHPGFDANNLLTMYLFLSPTKYTQGAQQSQVIGQILEGVRAVPGVRAASVVNALPIQNAISTTFDVRNRPAPDGQEYAANIEVIDPDYFATMGISLLHGRSFTRQDGAGAPQVMIISETMARRHFEGEDPLGQHITMRDWGPPLTGEIVGIVADVKANGVDQETRPMIYWNHPQFPQIFNNLVIRTEGDPMNVVAGVKNQIWSVDREQTISTIRTMKDWLTDSVAQRRFNVILLAVFAAVALLLAAVGIYGVMAYSVTQRTHELGVRMALGAQQSDLLRLVLGQGMRLAFVGIAVGLGGALALTRLMAGLLFGVGATDPMTFAAISSLLLSVALLACYLPARRATKVDPIIALRHD